MKRPALWAFMLLAIVLFAGHEAFAASSLGIKLPADPTKAYITLGILLVAAVMFFTEIVPLPITALLVPVALSLTNVVSSKVAFGYFGDPTVVLFMAMFIVGEATFITGFADKVGGLAVKLSKGNPVKLIVYTMAAIGLLSTVLSNTGTTVVAVPMVLGMCIKAKLAPGKVLMPVAFASSLGGTVTLVGTPPNGIINSMLAQTGQSPFGFFEFGLIGMPLLVVGLLYYAVIGHKFLPEKLHDDSEDDIEVDAKIRREHKMWHSVLIFAFVVAMDILRFFQDTPYRFPERCAVACYRRLHSIAVPFQKDGASVTAYVSRHDNGIARSGAGSSQLGSCHYFTDSRRCYKYSIHLALPRDLGVAGNHMRSDF